MLNQEKYLSLITNQFLELILMPTEQCNFRCVYCYEDFSIGKMSDETINGIKNLILKRIDNLRILKISWFGGEPLAAKSIVYDISEFIINLLPNHSQLKFISAMTTNGYLLNENIFNTLIKLRVNYFQISLDGTQTMHDKTRLRASGAATFATIWKNLLAAQASSHQFEIIIRIHLTPTNLEDIYALLDQLKAQFAHDKRFFIFFKAIENLGGPNSGSFKVLHGIDKQAIIKQFNDYLFPQLQAKSITANGPYVCYAAQTNSFVIRADGRIGKCTVAFNDIRNTVGSLAEDGTMIIDNDKLHLWTRGLKTLNEDTLHCPAKKLPQLVTKSKTIPITLQEAIGHPEQNEELA